MRKSVEYALKYPAASLAYVRAHAQEMQDAVMQQHIDLYVNHYTADLGEKGKKAVEILFETARNYGIIPNYEKSMFIHA
jgi:1,4-dihydroxy-6-naphthoate synthase